MKPLNQLRASIATAALRMGVARCFPHAVVGQDAFGVAPRVAVRGLDLAPSLLPVLSD